MLPSWWFSAFVSGTGHSTQPLPPIAPRGVIKKTCKPESTQTQSLQLSWAGFSANFVFGLLLWSMGCLLRCTHPPLYCPPCPKNPNGRGTASSRSLQVRELLMPSLTALDNASYNMHQSVIGGSGTRNLRGVRMNITCATMGCYVAAWRWRE